MSPAWGRNILTAATVATSERIGAGEGTTALVSDAAWALRWASVLWRDSSRFRIDSGRCKGNGLAGGEAGRKAQSPTHRL